MHPAFFYPRLDFRCRQHVRKVRKWREKRLRFNDETRYFTFNGASDRHHWKRFPVKANCTHTFVEGAAHNPAKVLKDRGRLLKMIQDCLDGTYSAKTLA